MTRFQSVLRLPFLRLVFATTAVVLLQAGCKGGASGDAPAATTQSSADDAAQAAVMQKGLDLMYKSNNPIAAADTFRAVLKMNPTHYGANFQLAKALDLSGKPTEARPLWTTILTAAESINDTATIATAKARLAQPDTVSQAAMMTVGLDKMYSKGDAAGAVEEYKKVLAKNPNHYGANFQIAKALDQAGRPAEAKPYWQKVLTAATQIKDQPTIDAANQKALVTLNTKCLNTSQDDGCFMSFVASGGLTQAASDDFAIGHGRPGNSSGLRFFVGGATYLVTIPTPGSTTFTAQFKRGAGNIASFSMHEIIVQVLSP